uniref:Calcineurin B homologous protein 3 n=1 Tax=Paramormyrops kingsleyae TaxID=1676925 RepID=A0A3B3QQ10_9TELE
MFPGRCCFWAAGYPPNPAPQYFVLLVSPVSPEQIQILHKRFKQLSNDEDSLRRDDFNNITDLACNPIRTQIIEAFFDKRNYRQNAVGSVEEISFEQFVIVMSHFLPVPLHNMTEEQRERMRREKLRFLFNMHDTDNDGTITLEEYKHVVEELLSRSGAIGKETAKGIADAAMLEVASITVGRMVPLQLYDWLILKDIEIETKMHIRFQNNACALC